MNGSREPGGPAEEGAPENTEARKAEIRRHIRDLKARRRYGAWGLFALVVISVLAIPDLIFRPALPESFRRFLGAAPDPGLISLALVIYVFSALILTLTRITQGSVTYRGWSHLFYIGAFYVFYTFAGVIRDTYWAIFVSGLIILGLENYSIRTHCREAIEEEMERLETL